MREYTKETCLYLVEALQDAKLKLEVVAENSNMSDEEWEKVEAALTKMDLLISRLNTEITYS